MASVLRPRHGRFISKDPINSTNLYPYVDNFPTGAIDPTGLASYLDIIKALGIIAGGLGIIIGNDISSNWWYRTFHIPFFESAKEKCRIDNHNKCMDACVSYVLGPTGHPGLAGGVGYYMSATGLLGGLFKWVGPRIGGGIISLAAPEVLAIVASIWGLISIGLIAKDFIASFVAVAACEKDCSIRERTELPFIDEGWS